MKLDMMISFSVNEKEDPEKSKDKVKPLLIDDEKILLVYTNVRDKLWFTDRRIIAMDVQGLLGNKVSYTNFFYKKITAFSVETAGTFDGDGDFKIWVSGYGVFEVKFHKKLDISRVANFMSNTLNQ